MDHQLRVHIARSMRVLADSIESGAVTPLSLVVGAPIIAYPMPHGYPKTEDEGRVGFMTVTYVQPPKTGASRG